MTTRSVQCLPYSVHRIGRLGFLMLIGSVFAYVPAAGQHRPGDTELPDAKPVPALQVIPLPHDQALFRLGLAEFEHRRITVVPGDGADATESWTMLIDLELAVPDDQPVTLGETAFGIIGVRMAKSIGVHEGGGRILNSEGQRNEDEMFRKPAWWVDYSGPVTNASTGGITLMDHPANPHHPAPFHVRDEGWMGACLTFDGPITIQPAAPLRLRYCLCMHAGVPDRQTVDAVWSEFSRLPMSALVVDRD